MTDLRDHEGIKRVQLIQGVSVVWRDAVAQDGVRNVRQILVFISVYFYLFVNDFIYFIYLFSF